MILLTCPDLQKGGGVASYCRILQPYLGSDVDYFTVGARNDDEKGWRLVTRMLRDYAAFRRKLKDGRYDLVHLNPSLGKKALLRDGLLVKMAKARGCKVLVFIHGWDEGCEAVLREKYMRIFQRVYFQADAFVVLASEFREKLLAMACDKPIFIETTTLGDEIFTRNDTKPRLPADAPFNILYLSRIEREKGVYEALDAFHIVKAKHPHVTMTVAGDGAELSRARQYVTKERIQDITFTGYITGEEKQRTFSEAQVYLFPTWYGEGMPISVLEAMAYGLPVITRPVGGLKDFFNDGKMGFITESRDPHRFVELLEAVMLNPDLWSSISAFNRRYAEEHFSAGKVAARIKRIYAEIL
jgi:glycosyltransferase involved in cell wall biosynthesis